MRDDVKKLLQDVHNQLQRASSQASAVEDRDARASLVALHAAVGALTKAVKTLAEGRESADT